MTRQMTRIGIGPASWTAAWVAAIVLLGCGAAGASIVTTALVAGSGADSGWSVTYNDAQVDLTVDQVSLGDGGFVVLQISKTFATGPNPFTGQIPPVLMDFSQRLGDAATVGTIVIADETIRNQTGVTWTDFHWIVLDHNQTWFDIDASGAFGIQPPPEFQSQQWTALPGHPDRASDLSVFGGFLVAGGTYFPGSEDSDLVIRSDLGGDLPATFTLKELPTVPEPATLALMVLGGLALLAARRRPH